MHQATAVQTSDTTARIELSDESGPVDTFKAYKDPHWGNRWLVVGFSGTYSTPEAAAAHVADSWNKPEDTDPEAGWDSYFAHAAGYHN